MHHACGKVQTMRYVIVTGMSGAGKSTALRMLEDAGYFCIDNLPTELVGKVAELAFGSAQEHTGVAIGLDVRSLRDPSAADRLLAVLAQSGKEMAGAQPYEILFLEAEDAVLVRRYKETRRNHPLAKGERISDGIEREREILKDLKKRADFIIDTSRLLTRDLRGELERIFVTSGKQRSMFITVLSFGFKYGIPADADLVFDVRFLPNPYYEEHLRMLTGEDEAVRSFVCADGTVETFEQKWFDLLAFLIPNYIGEGKRQLVIAVGCTGGKHRSVTMAMRLFAHLKQDETLGVRLEHRDIRR